MVWFLALHIATLLIWSGALLYLPALIAARPDQLANIDHSPKQFDSVARFLFTRVATPFALAAIISGTAVFLINRTTDPWLIIKLTLVSGLVVCHCLAGLLVLRAEARRSRHIRAFSLLLAAMIATLMLGIVWVVLGKPPEEALPWIS